MLIYSSPGEVPSATWLRWHLPGLHHALRLSCRPGLPSMSPPDPKDVQACIVGLLSLLSFICGNVFLSTLFLKGIFTA